MNEKHLLLKVITEGNKRFIITVATELTVNELIKTLKKYFLTYFRKKYYVEYLLTEDKFILLENLAVGTFFKNGDICYVKGKEGEDTNSDSKITNKVKYDFFMKKNKIQDVGVKRQKTNGSFAEDTHARKNVCATNNGIVTHKTANAPKVISNTMVNNYADTKGKGIHRQRNSIEYTNKQYIVQDKYDSNDIITRATSSMSQAISKTINARQSSISTTTGMSYKENTTKVSAYLGDTSMRANTVCSNLTTMKRDLLKTHTNNEECLSSTLYYPDQELRNAEPMPEASLSIVEEKDQDCLKIIYELAGKNENNKQTKKEAKNKIAKCKNMLKIKEKEDKLKAKESDGEPKSKENDDKLKAKEKEDRMKTKENDDKLNAEETEDKLRIKEKGDVLKVNASIKGAVESTHATGLANNCAANNTSGKNDVVTNASSTSNEANHVSVSEIKTKDIVTVGVEAQGGINTSKIETKDACSTICEATSATRNINNVINHDDLFNTESINKVVKKRQPVETKNIKQFKKKQKINYEYL